MMTRLLETNNVLSQVLGSDALIRYVAIAHGQEVAIKQREDLSAASSGESDRYEELLVNPALLMLTTQRGDIDCGGLEYVIVRYGNFFQIVMQFGEGHISAAVEPDGDPVTIASKIGRFRGRGALAQKGDQIDT